jgi:hypothetical protein
LEVIPEVDVRRVSLFVFLITLLAFVPAMAQEEYPTLTLRLHRDFGYRGGCQIQGRFSMHVDGPDDLTRVQFFIDGHVVGEIEQKPFVFTFSTGEYPLGAHILQAKGYTASGEILSSEQREVEFVSAETGTLAAVKIVLPLLAGIAAVTVLAALVTGSYGRRRGADHPGEYGIAGGAVCPKCGLPFSRHVLSPNVVVGKLERCPHCTRWSIVRRAKPEALELAETKLAAENASGLWEPGSGEARLARQIEESRFED